MKPPDEFRPVPHRRREIGDGRYRDTYVRITSYLTKEGAGKQDLVSPLETTRGLGDLVSSWSLPSSSSQKPRIPWQRTRDADRYPSLDPPSPALPVRMWWRFEV
jgi:hypothetical protein